MRGEITGSRLHRLAVRAGTRRENHPEWGDEIFYIVHTGGDYLKKVPARRLSFSSRFHRYFDNYFFAWACQQSLLKEQRHEEHTSA